MNTALTSPELELMRSEAPFYGNFYLSVAPSTQVATARINQTVYTDQLMQVTVDTTTDWTAVEKDMLAWIGSTPGSRDKGVYRVRKTPTSTILYIGEISYGDPGLSTQIAPQRIADNDYVTIVDETTMWSVFPRITYTDGVATFFKDGDITYTNQNLTTQPFAVNIGPNLSDWVDTETGELLVTIEPETWDTNGSTYPTWEWSISGTHSFVSGSSSSRDITVSLAPGHHFFKLKVTRSSGNFVVVKRHIHAHHPTIYPPIELTAASISLQQTSANGRATLADPADASLILDGTMVNLWTDASFGGERIESMTRQLTGFIRTINVSMNPDETTVSFPVISALDEAKNLIAFSQVIYYKASPTNWQEVVGYLMHLDFFVFYLLYYHSTFLSLFDYHASGLTSLTSYVWVTNPGTISDQVLRAGARVRATIGPSSDGALWLRTMLDTATDAARAVAVNRMTVTPDDGVVLEYDYDTKPKVGKIEVLAIQAGLAASPQAYRSDAFGKVGGQAAGSDREDNLIALSQSDTNRIAGSLIAAANNPLPRILVDASAPVFEPALHYFVTVDMTDADTPGITINHRCYVKSVDISTSIDGDIVTKVSFVAETNGNATPGQTMPLDIGNANDPGSVTLPDLDPISGIELPTFPPVEIPSWPDPPPVGWPGLPDGDPGTEEPPLPEPVVRSSKVFVVPINTNPPARLTEISSDGTHTWESIGSGLEDFYAETSPIFEIYDGCMDPTNIGTRWLTTSHGLFKCLNIWATTPKWVQVATPTKIFGSVHATAGVRGMQILMHRAKPGWIWLNTGNVIARSPNYGKTWTYSNMDTRTIGMLPDDWTWATADWWIPEMAIGKSYNVSAGYLFGSWAVYVSGSFNVHFVKSEDWGANWIDLGVFSGGYFTYPKWKVPRLRSNGAVNVADSSLEVIAVNGNTGGGSGGAGTFWRSTNGGDTFTDVKAISGTPNPLYARRSILNPYNKPKTYIMDMQYYGGSNPNQVHKTVNNWASVVVYKFDGSGLLPWNLNGYGTNPSALLLTNSSLGMPSGYPGLVFFYDDFFDGGVADLSDVPGHPGGVGYGSRIIYADLNDPYEQ